MKSKKRGIYFTMDALFAVILIGLALILSSKYFISDTSQKQLNYYSEDIINCLSNIKISEFNNSYVKSLVISGDISNPSNTLIEQIGEFYVLNKTNLAQNLSAAVSNDMLSGKFGFEVLVNDESIYFKNSESSTIREVISSRRLISGIEKFRPLKGATSKVFLEGITRKKYSSYVYFGGFIGQGNLSVYTEDIPLGVNISNLYLELDSGSDFYFYINNILCGALFTPGTGTMTADGWDISNCNSSIVLGAKNNYSIAFPGDISDAYVGGGFIRVDYYTDQMQQEEQVNTLKSQLPGIIGIINIYSSFYVPGELNNISVFLHYYINTTNSSNNTFYFSIGNSTIFIDTNLTGNKNKTLTAANVTAYLPLSYFNNKIIPIRAGFENVSFGYIYFGNADVAIITDISGSMDSKMEGSGGATFRNCNDGSFNNSDTARLSVAKCLDNEFAVNIINTTGNQVGIVSYDTDTRTWETRAPTTNLTNITITIGNSSPITGYDSRTDPNYYTCICCGINSARMILTSSIANTTLIGRKSNWKYTNMSLNSFPGNDASGNAWYDVNYANESQWYNGTAILGATNSYSYYPAVNKEIGSNFTNQALFADLWEYFPGDTAGPPNDFTSNKLNHTGNTYGIGGANDGWDWDTNNGAGPFGYDDKIDYNNISSGRLELDSGTGSPVRNRCTTGSFTSDCSGAYGISVNITQQMYDTIQANGKAQISFWYQWQQQGSSPFEEGDEVWIKARWTSPTSGQHYLGSSVDSGHQGTDTDNEITAIENPNNNAAGSTLQNLSDWVEGPGIYYLELGGKLLASSNDEWGYWRFDDLQIKVTNSTDYYYFRKNFTISDLNLVKKGILNVLSDDNAIVYLNGNLIDTDYSEHEATYWNRRGIIIPEEYFVLGKNVIAVELKNSKDAAKFDLELIGLNDSRDLAMMVMTDGIANRYCSNYNDDTGSGSGSSSDPRDISWAINSSCYAREKYGITVYAVGYSDDADESTLQQIAACGSGIYAKSSNVTALQEFYHDVASSIVTASRHSQTIELSGHGGISSSVLYDDSYINIGYTAVAEPLEFGEISLIIEESDFKNCSFNVYIPPDVRVSDSKITSYSSEHWTDGVTVNENIIYNLSYFSRDYTTLGDPYIINVPSSYLTQGNNSFSIRTGDSPENSTDCSLNNTLIYTAQVKASVSYSDVLEKAVGCKWFIEFDDGENTTVNVPPSYSGLKECYYTNLTKIYDENDTYDDAMFNLLDNLDFDNDGRIYVNIKESNLVVGAISVGKVPYPWGPAIAEVKVWR